MAMRQNLHGLNTTAEKVVLFRLILPGDDDETAEEDLKELALLTKTAGGKVVGILTQKKNSPDPAFFIGKGKVNELARLVSETGAHTVICDDDLKPAQVRNISNAMGNNIKVLDRSGLILDIFATHARTPESKIQVELAQLEYILPRLAGMWEHLERQYGAIGVRGPGEKQLEMDRRAINRHISVLKKKLKKIERERKTQRKQRDQFFRVSLVGYTNAGKSSLLNRLTGAEALVQNKLFATLDSTTRRFSDGETTVLITDTVGFIKKLPHNLIESFKSTLAETREADLILIISDASHSAISEHLEIVANELNNISAPENRIQVMNKIDLLTPEQMSYIRRTFPKSHLISAKTGTGIDSLKSFILDQAKKNQKEEYNEQN